VVDHAEQQQRVHERPEERRARNHGTAPSIRAPTSTLNQPAIAGGAREVMPHSAFNIATVMSVGPARGIRGRDESLRGTSSSEIPRAPSTIRLRAASFCATDCLRQPLRGRCGFDSAGLDGSPPPRTTSGFVRRRARARVTTLRQGGAPAHRSLESRRRASCSLSHV
jgi:hypothetical protein